jgi:hypothetical protein
MKAFVPRNRAAGDTAPNTQNDRPMMASASATRLIQRDRHATQY